jgi:Relaxase/Mobilisation nuclease domain
MIPRIAKGGTSFKGAFQYFCHDKGQQTTERVAWTQTENMLTDNPDLAWKVMAYTAMAQERLKTASGQTASGRKLQKPVFSYSLAWHPEQDPDKDHMLATARKSIEALGLTEYETLIVAHRDEPQRHVHIILNRVHPVTGIAADLGNSKRKLSEFAHAYEQENGKIYCKQREENIEKQKEGEKTSYADLNIQQAWDQAADGKSFVEALKSKGYQLALGRKRLVVIDPQGKILNPNRHIKGVRSKDMRRKLGDFPLSELFDATSLSQKVRAEQKRAYEARQKGAGNEKTEGKKVQPTPAMINRMQDRHLEERRQLHNGLYDNMEAQIESLKEYYHVRERHRALVELKHKIKHPSWWRKFFGLTRHDKETFTEDLRSLRNAESLISERMKWLQQQNEEELTKQQRRHELERALLNERGTDDHQPRPIRIPKRQKAAGLDFTP